MRLPFLLPVLLAAAAAPDESALTKYEVVPADVRDALFIDVTSSDFWTPPLTPALKALDGAGRIAAIKGFAQFAKAYTSSSDFTSRYSKWRAHELGDAPKKPPSYEEFVKQQKAQEKEMEKQAQGQLDSMPADQKAQIDAMMKQMGAATQSMTPEQKAQMDAMMKQMGMPGGAGAAPDAKSSKELYEQTVVAKYKEDQAAYQEHLAKCPEKPSAAVKLALQHFLTATADVDFDAKLVEVGGRHVFADDTQESKPEVWKRAFRAGKEATTAARQAAQSWLAELK